MFQPYKFIKCFIVAHIHPITNEKWLSNKAIESFRLDESLYIDSTFP